MVLVGAVTVLASCRAPEPNASVPIPLAYRAGPSGRTVPVSPEWLASFGSADLSRLGAGAIAGNLDLEAAIARLNAAESQAVVARAALLPTIGGTGDTSRQQGAASRAGSLGGFNSFGLGLLASYEVDLFGANRYAARAADLTARATRADRDTVALATLAAVANTYFAVLAAQDRLRIANDNLRIATRVLDAVRGRTEQGTGTALDIAQQESVVATQRASIPPLTLDLEANRNTLAVLLGRTPDAVRSVGGSLDRLRLPVVRPGLPSQLLLRRPDIARDEANLASASASVAAARAAFFPSIQLTASGGFQSAALSALLGGGAFVYSLGAGLTQPIFDPGTLQGGLGFQTARASELAAIYRRTIVQAFSDVETALTAVRERARHEARLREAVAASRRALDITEQRLREGTIDVVTLFTIQTQLFGTQDALAAVRLFRFQAAVALFQALGGGWTGERAAPVGQAEPVLEPILAPEVAP